MTAVRSARREPKKTPQEGQFYYVRPEWIKGIVIKAEEAL